MSETWYMLRKDNQEMKLTERAVANFYVKEDGWTLVNEVNLSIDAPRVEPWYPKEMIELKEKILKEIEEKEKQKEEEREESPC